MSIYAIFLTLLKNVVLTLLDLIMFICVIFLCLLGGGGSIPPHVSRSLRSLAYYPSYRKGAPAGARYIPPRTIRLRYRYGECPFGYRPPQGGRFDECL